MSHKVLKFFIAFVWLVNGFFCKIFNLVPRHEQIVSEILNLSDGRLLTVFIGAAEVIMAVWILSNYRSRFCAIAQMIVVIAMNLLEYLLVPELLFWGRLNSLFALFFIILIYYNEFILKEKQ